MFYSLEPELEAEAVDVSDDGGEPVRETQRVGHDVASRGAVGTGPAILSSSSVVEVSPSRSRNEVAGAGGRGGGGASARESSHPS